MHRTTQMSMTLRERIRSLQADLRNMKEPECNYHPDGPCHKCLDYRKKEDIINELIDEEMEIDFSKLQEEYNKEKADAMDISRSPTPFLLDDEDDEEMNNKPKEGP